MSLILHIPEPGQLVDVRQRRYVVVEVSQGTLSSDLLKPALSQHLVSLASVEDDDLGEELPLGHLRDMKLGVGADVLDGYGDFQEVTSFANFTRSDAYCLEGVRHRQQVVAVGSIDAAPAQMIGEPRCLGAANQGFQFLQVFAVQQPVRDAGGVHRAEHAGSHRPSHRVVDRVAGEGRKREQAHRDRRPQRARRA